MMEYRSLKIISRKEYKEIHLQMVPRPGETAEVFTRKIADLLKDNNAVVLRATFFGNLSEKEKTIQSLEKYLSVMDFPVTWIEGGNCSDSFINGVYILSVSGISVQRIHFNGKTAGSCLRTGDAESVYLGELFSDPSLPPYEQALQIFHSAESILGQTGLSFENTVRTWFYLDDILEWYNDFNRARTLFFRQHDIFSKLVPASTGISGKNPAGSRVALELNAIRPLSSHVSIQRVKSPLQCSAEDYGSSFSRAIRITDGDYSYLTVSGTASIDPDGKTAHTGDHLKQIDLTFRVVRAILDSQGFKSSDIIRAYAYCSQKSFTADFLAYLKKQFPHNFAYICAENKICRNDLLFEFEVDVARLING